jgi:hypothetical protein
MGLNNSFLLNLCELMQRRALEGFCTVIEIGAQQLTNAFLRADHLISECYRLLRQGTNPARRACRKQRRRRHGVALHPPRVSSGNQSASATRPSNLAAIATVLRLTSIATAYPNTCEMRFARSVQAGRGHVSSAPGGRPYGPRLDYLYAKFFWSLCREIGYEPLMLRVLGHPPNLVPQEIAIAT